MSDTTGTLSSWPTEADALNDAGEESALHSLLEQIVPYGMHAPIPGALLTWGVIGSGTMLLSGLLALLFSNPQAVRTGTFFLLLASEGAGLDSVLQSIAVPAVVIGLLLLGMDLYLAHGWHHENWWTAIVAQSVVGCVVGFFCALFVGIVLLNIATWLAIVAAVLAIIGMILSGGG